MRIDWMWGWGGLGGIGLVGLLLFLLFWGLVIAALVLVIRRLVRADERHRYDGPPPWERYGQPPGYAPPGSVPPGVVPPPGVGPPSGPVSPLGTVPPGVGAAVRSPDALEVLRDRYARGEIDEAEFDRRRAFLESERGGGPFAGGPGGNPAT